MNRTVRTADPVSFSVAFARSLILKTQVHEAVAQSAFGEPVG